MITKTGADLAYLDRKIIDLGKRFNKWIHTDAASGATLSNVEVARRGATKTKGLFGHAFAPVKALGRAAAGGVYAAGNVVAKHPGVAIPALAATTIAATGLPSRLRTSLLHADPELNATQRSGFTGVRMRDGLSAEAVKPNLYF